MPSAYSRPVIACETKGTNMTQDSKLTIFATGNGDAILIEARGKQIMTDVNYRGDAQDGGNDDCPDVGEPIRNACADQHLHLFVLTHPDCDHLQGYGDIFHLGRPETHDPKPKEGPAKILVDEIWCSPYGAEPNYTNDTSEPVVAEIKRRKALIGTAEGAKSGNRLRILDTSVTSGGIFSEGISWELLAPTPAEADIPEGNEECQPSSNDSSLVIRWNISVDGGDNLILLGGDSSADVWERIGEQNLEDRPNRIAWHLLVPPHHTSRYVLGRKSEEGKFEFSDDAIVALSQMRGHGWVVSSSKAIKNNDDDPPSWSAKQKYLNILADGGSIDSAKDRFLCTGEYDDGKPGNVVFHLTAGGPALDRGGPRRGPVVTVASRGGNYGLKRV